MHVAVMQRVSAGGVANTLTIKKSALGSLNPAYVHPEPLAGTSTEKGVAGKPLPCELEAWQRRWSQPLSSALSSSIPSTKSQLCLPREPAPSQGLYGQGVVGAALRLIMQQGPAQSASRLCPLPAGCMFHRVQLPKDSSLPGPQALGAAARAYISVVCAQPASGGVTRGRLESRQNRRRTRWAAGGGHSLPLLQAVPASVTFSASRWCSCSGVCGRMPGSQLWVKGYLQLWFCKDRHLALRRGCVILPSHQQSRELSSGLTSSLISPCTHGFHVQGGRTRGFRRRMSSVLSSGPLGHPPRGTSAGPEAVHILMHCCSLGCWPQLFSRAALTPALSVPPGTFAWPSFPAPKAPPACSGRGPWTPRTPWSSTRCSGCPCPTQPFTRRP